jgi:L-malate glycosyltransferase
MKILMFPFELRVCGTTVNAVELASALRDYYGHEVVLFATPGPMSSLVENRGLRFVSAPRARSHPSRARMQALREAVNKEKPDLLYAWDWPQALDAYYGVHLPMRLPMAITSMSMQVDRILPKNVPTTFGTPQPVDEAKAAGRRCVRLLLPPVDLQHNAPGVVEAAAFRKHWNIKEELVTLVTVSRLDNQMKGESLFRTVEAVRTLGNELPIQFVIVGDGGARPALEKRAQEINAELGRRAVILTGQLVDPRPTYACADVSICMGGSSLRAMAFGKPVIVVGEQGFSSLLSPETSGSLYYNGLYGRGDGQASGEQLTGSIRQLVKSAELRQTLGLFSRQFVLRHFSLEVVCSGLDEFVRDAATQVPRIRDMAADGLRSAAVYLRERRFLGPFRSLTLSQAATASESQF